MRVIGVVGFLFTAIAAALFIPQAQSLQADLGSVPDYVSSFFSGIPYIAIIVAVLITIFGIIGGMLLFARR